MSTASIAIAPADGGERRTIVRGFLDVDGELTFSHDSQYVFFTTLRPNVIWRVSVDGGAPERLSSVPRVVKHLSAHPDGRSLALTVGGNLPEVWVWDNLLPEPIEAR